MHKLLIGLVTYNDLHFLKESLPVLEELRINVPADIVIMDTAENDEIRDFVRKEFPHFDFIRHSEGNIGYGRAYSYILKQNPGHSYYLVYTSDVFLDVKIVKEFLHRMQQDKDLAMCAGKLHYWDIENHCRTNIIDTLGIVADKKHHFYERGSGEEDRGQYDDELENFFGLSGAAFMIRTSVVPKLHGNEWQLFDDRMWMYKEDVDLAYRLRWLNEKIALFPEVWGWHARSVRNHEGQGMRALVRADKGKPAYGRLHSYANHLLMLKNNFSFKYGFLVFFRVFFYEFLKAMHHLVLHPRAFLKGMKALFLLRGKPSDRVNSARAMLSYFK